jgi:hypothetical protein
MGTLKQSEGRSVATKSVRVRRPEVVQREWRTVINKQRAKYLLAPVATFLESGGLTKEESLAMFASAFDAASRRTKRLEHIGHPFPYAHVVSAWTRRKKYLDRSGRPRSLPLGGRSGFSALVREISPTIHPRAAIRVLERYGTVRRTRDGRYRLAKLYFQTGNKNTQAYEPVAYFLGDATATLSRLLRARRSLSEPRPFWRKVYTIAVTRSIAREFTEFARERGLLFLEELDDWLEAHRDSSVPAQRGHMVGVGLFSIYDEVRTVASIP